jgi:hypothetical protein
MSTFLGFVVTSIFLRADVAEAVPCARKARVSEIDGVTDRFAGLAGTA